jgi:hypothetical protein
MTSIARDPSNAVAVSSLRFAEWASLVWGFLWRGVVFTILAALAGGLVGGIAGLIIGLVAGTVGSSLEQIQRISQMVGAVLGFVVGIVGLRFYISWLLHARFGRLRLALVRG